MKKRKVTILLNVLGDETLTFIMHSRIYQQIRLRHIFETLEKYCEPRKNTVYERYVYFQMTQNPEESFGEFITRLKGQATKCEFGVQNDLLVRDKIVNGINDVVTVERLLREESEKLTLETAIKICQTAESAKEQIKVVKASCRRKSQENVEIDVVKQQNPVNVIKTQDGYGHTINCRNCGRQHKVKQCPAYGKSCNKCSKPNHFAKVCRGNKMYKAESINVNESKQYEIGENKSVNTTKGTIWKESLRIGNSRDFLVFQLDTGAQANILSMYHYNRINKKGKMQRTNDVLVAYGGEKIGRNNRVE